MSAEPSQRPSRIRPPGELNPVADPVLDFPDRGVDELSPADYATLGFVGGLEVHQQLLTHSKLFCRCPAGRYVTHVDGEVLRHMRPTLSELGEYDGTALMEFKTKKEIVYLLERGSVCTYEMDDTPPFEIDDEAVAIAIEIAQLFNLNLVSELHVMRKQYLDGSIPTGFQRTAMIGLAGVIPFHVPELHVERELHIRQLSVEEDSCREVSDLGHRITFRTDRLGMPLIETVTEPDLRNPRELQAAAKLLADVARASRKVRRGTGAARQDVNVSIAGGRRVEIKGVPYHRGLRRLVHTEAYRQLNLLRVRHEMARRGARDDALRIPDGGAPWDSSPLVAVVGPELRRSAYGPLRDATARGDTVVAIRLPGFAGLLAHRTQPGLTFAHELAERVRVIACPVHRPFMLHSDNADTRLSASEWRTVRERVGGNRDDAIVIVWAPEADAATAAREIAIRAAEATKGIPAETRQANPDGTTGFERILPGPDRMYPDTDTPPLPIRDALVAELRAHLPETPWARAARYETMGLARAPAQRLATAPWADLFDHVAPALPDSARRLATALETRLPYHRRQGRRPWVPDADDLRTAIRAIEAGEIRTEALSRMVDALVCERGIDTADLLARFRGGAEVNERIARTVSAVAERAHELNGRPADAVLRWAMGAVMPELVGRAAPRDVRRRLAEALALTADRIAT